MTNGRADELMPVVSYSAWLLAIIRPKKTRKKNHANQWQHSSSITTNSQAKNHVTLNYITLGMLAVCDDRHEIKQYQQQIK
jgi:hypothetical protein